MKFLHAKEDIIRDRYRILDILGQGGVGITYASEDLQTGEKVALKTLSLRRLQDWKAIELFEREARILAQLDCPGIPRYIDYFQIDTPEDRSFYLIQQLAEGKSLAVLRENSWQPQEAEVKDIAKQILKILIYLQQLIPPVIHRDIKPQNIIRSEDGKIFLVDFGAVQDTYHNTVTGGSTVVGTYGYMAPEQFRGQAVLSTDLYGLGTTLLFLLTGKCPADLSQRNLKIQFRSEVQISKHFADCLEKMLEPLAEDRFVSAQEALAVLQKEKVFSKNKPFKPKKQKSKSNTISVQKTADELLIKIPRVGLRDRYNFIWSLLPFICNGFSLLILSWLVREYSSGLDLVIGIVGLFLFISILRLGLRLLPDRFIFLRLFLIIILGLFLLSTVILFAISSQLFAPIIIGLFFLGMWMPGSFLFSGGFPTQIKINRENFYFKRGWLGLWGKTIKGATENIDRVKVIYMNMPMKKEPLSCCEIKFGQQEEYILGLFLTLEENAYLAREIKAFLKQAKRSN